MIPRASALIANHYNLTKKWLITITICAISSTSTNSLSGPQDLHDDGGKMRDSFLVMELSGPNIDAVRFALSCCAICHSQRPLALALIMNHHNVVSTTSCWASPARLALIAGGHWGGVHNLLLHQRTTGQVPVAVNPAGCMGATACEDEGEPTALLPSFQELAQIAHHYNLTKK